MCVPTCNAPLKPKKSQALTQKTTAPKRDVSTTRLESRPCRKGEALCAIPVKILTPMVGSANVFAKPGFTQRLKQALLQQNSFYFRCWRE